MKQKIYEWFSSLKNDKVAHFILFSYLFITLLIVFSPTVSLILTLAAAAFVELIHDKKWGKGTPEWLDFVASAIGPVYIYIIIILFL